MVVHLLLANLTHFLGPLGALCVGCISRSFIFALLFNNSLTINDIIGDIMNFLLGPALRLVFSPAYLWTLNVTILHKRSSAHLNGFESNGFVFDETVLPVVLL